MRTKPSPCEPISAKNALPPSSAASPAPAVAPTANTPDPTWPTPGDAEEQTARTSTRDAARIRRNLRNRSNLLESGHLPKARTSLSVGPIPADRARHHRSRAQQDRSLYAPFAARTRRDVLTNHRHGPPETLDATGSNGGEGLLARPPSSVPRALA